MPDLSFLASNTAATAAMVAAAATAAFASMKFFSDKAAKVTDFRKAWIETLRQAVAEFSGSTHTIVGRIAIRKVHHVPYTGARRTDAGWIKRLFASGKLDTTASQFDKAFETELLSHWSMLRLSYNKIILHQNPAEHAAYIAAEEAIATYTKGTKPDPVIRENVSAFLHWCIRLADHETRHVLNKPRWPWKKRNKEDFEGTETLEGGALEAARKGIKKACTNAGACMLLSVFATRQLLHGDYDTVIGNAWRIEHGIRTVDTSAAIVIKGIWEDIKKGEPTYRRISVAAIVLPIVLLACILTALYFSQKKPEQGGRERLLPAVHMNR